MKAGTGLNHEISHMTGTRSMTTIWRWHRRCRISFDPPDSHYNSTSHQIRLCLITELSSNYSLDLGQRHLSQIGATGLCIQPKPQLNLIPTGSDTHFGFSTRPPPSKNTVSSLPPPFVGFSIGINDAYGFSRDSARRQGPALAHSTIRAGDII